MSLAAVLMMVARDAESLAAQRYWPSSGRSCCECSTLSNNRDPFDRQCLYIYHT